MTFFKSVVLSNLKQQIQQNTRPDKYCTQRTVRTPFFYVRLKLLRRTHLCIPFPHRLSLYVFSICFNWEICFTIEIEKFVRLPCIKLNAATISIKSGFHLRLPVASRMAEEEKGYKMFHTYKLNRIQ